MYMHVMSSAARMHSLQLSTRIPLLPSGARYKLTGFIGKVDQPLMAFSLTVKMEVSYTLVDTQSGTTLWTRDIASEYTAKTGEAFAAVKRLRLANEGAARENIQQAIAAMATLTL